MIKVRWLIQYEPVGDNMVKKVKVLQYYDQDQFDSDKKQYGLWLDIPEVEDDPE